MKKPNFFIIGAPKCGTTSLYSWLAGHPSIFLPERKEPTYFNNDHSFTRCFSLNEYESLFRNATQAHKAVGEASVWYLYSQNAVKNILDYAKDALFIVCLRNPVDMAYSLHQQLVVSGVEKEFDFQTAWNRQFTTSRNQHQSHDVRLLYGRVCSLGEQIDRLYQAVDKRRVLTVFLEDMKCNSRQEYLKTLNFLCVMDDGRTYFPTVNSSKQLRYKFIRRAATIAGDIKLRIGLRKRLGVEEILNRLITRTEQRPPLEGRFRQELSEYFNNDISKLSEILQRDLSHWIYTKPNPTVSDTST